MAAHLASNDEAAPVRAQLQKAHLNGEGLAIARNGALITWDSVSRKAAQFAAELGGFGPCRLAIHAEKPESVIAALIASVETGCELILARQNVQMNRDFMIANQVAAVFDCDLKLLTRVPITTQLHGCAVILSTSGTTGIPKLAVHTIERLLGRIKSQKEPGCWLLTYHPASFAGLQVLLTALCSGSRLVCSDNPTPTSGGLAQLMREHEVTHVSGTPTFYRALLLMLNGDCAPRSLRQITLGGEIVDQPLLDSLHAACPNARITHIYASTEAGALFAVNDLRAGFPAEWLTKGIDGCQLRIRNSVLEVRSPRAMRGYISQPAKLSSDGWLMTGDIVKLTGDRVVFLGREDTVINVGGAKVIPEEVETVLLQVPGVRDARVYGAKNPITGYVLAAEITWNGPVPEEQARAQIFGFLSARLESFKVPRMYRFSLGPKVNEAGKKERN